MKGMTISKADWQNETAESNLLFAEADRLNEIAFALLNDKPTTAETVKLFQLAKNAANAKYEEAHLAWRKAKGNLKNQAEPVLNRAEINIVKAADAWELLNHMSGTQKNDRSIG